MPARFSRAYLSSPIGILTLLLVGGLLASLAPRSAGLDRRPLLWGATLWVLGTYLPLADSRSSRWNARTGR